MSQPRETGSNPTLVAGAPPPDAADKPPGQQTTVAAITRAGAAADGLGVAGPPPVPPLLSGRYRMGEVLGQGGHATVYRAHDELLGIDRAVKVLMWGMSSRSALLARLRDEARSMAKLAHPNVLNVLDMGHDAGVDYVVTELAEGGSLEARLQDGPLTPEVAVRYLVQVLAALETAHAAGIIHRDVKPHNILLDRSGRAFLADFGIALLSATDDPRKTKAGATMGSFAYMPPEQRLDARGVGIAADLYAVGATLFALITGENPVDLFTAGEDSERWRAIPGPLQRVIFKATRYYPDDRYTSAREMALALLDAAGYRPGGPVDPIRGAGPTSSVQPFEPAAGSTPLPPSEGTAAFADAAHTFMSELPGAPWRRPARRVGSHRWWWVGGALVALLLGSIAAGWLWSQSSRPPPVTGLEPSAPSLPSVPPAIVAPPTPVVAAPPAVALPATPAPEVSSPPKPRTPTPPKVAVWDGTLGGRVAILSLSSGSGDVTGVLEVRFQGNAIPSQVVGRIDPVTGEVALADLGEGPDLGTYTGQISKDGTRMSGTLERTDGRTVPFSFRMKQ